MTMPSAKVTTHARKSPINAAVDWVVNKVRGRPGPTAMLKPNSMFRTQGELDEWARKEAAFLVEMHEGKKRLAEAKKKLAALKAREAELIIEGNKLRDNLRRTHDLAAAAGFPVIDRLPPEERPRGPVMAGGKVQPVKAMTTAPAVPRNWYENYNGNSLGL